VERGIRSILLTYKRELPLYVLLLHAFETTPQQLPNRSEYAGCKSWVELDQKLSAWAAQPALDAGQFESLRQKIRTLLEV
jgi:hypothetical protein